MLSKYGEKTQGVHCKRRQWGDQNSFGKCLSIRNEVGNIDAAIVVFTDITEFRKTDLKLKRNGSSFKPDGRTAKVAVGI
ncbi:MAG: hypothetical protein IPG53_21560 [Ignavibacteriales bacterium]|nr:hypothetical protein [Ignavibacteriales bacterium]